MTAADVTPYENLRCTACDYDLRGLPADSRCPECGQLIEESRRATPVVGWARGFRRGVLALAGGMVLTAAGEMVVNSRRGVFLPWRVNPDGLLYLLHAVFFVPAVWWMTGSAPFLGRDPRRLRVPLLIVTGAGIACAGLTTMLFGRASYWGTVVLLAAYSAGPLLFTAEFWLLLVILGRATRAARDTLPRMVVAGVRWMVCYSLFGPALFMAVVNLVRIRYIDHPVPSDGYWIPEKWNRLLAAVLADPAALLASPAWFACLAVVVHTWFRLRRAVVVRR